MQEYVKEALDTFLSECDRRRGLEPVPTEEQLRLERERIADEFFKSVAGNVEKAFAPIRGQLHQRNVGAHIMSAETDVTVNDTAMRNIATIVIDMPIARERSRRIELTFARSLPDATTAALQVFARLNADDPASGPIHPILQNPLGVVPTEQAIQAIIGDVLRLAAAR